MSCSTQAVRTMHNAARSIGSPISSGMTAMQVGRCSSCGWFLPRSGVCMNPDCPSKRGLPVRPFAVDVTRTARAVRTIYVEAPDAEVARHLATRRALAQDWNDEPDEEFTVLAVEAAGQLALGAESLECLYCGWSGTSEQAGWDEEAEEWTCPNCGGAEEIIIR